jgi:hypothetical protein
MAVSVVSLLLGGLAVVCLLIGGVLLVPLAACGALRTETLMEPWQPVRCPVEGPLDVPDVFVPADILPDLLFFTVTGLVLLVLLLGFRRQRRWAWVGLMGWAGLNLAVALFRYFTYPETPFIRFLMLAINTLVVLVLNMEAVQLAFGIRQLPPERAVRRVDERHEVGL